MNGSRTGAKAVEVAVGESFVQALSLHAHVLCK